MNKKGNFFVGVLLVIVIAFTIMIFNFFSYECVRDVQCGEGSFCGVDHQCHSYPTKTVHSNTKAAAIFGGLVGLAIIAATYINKNKQEKQKSFY